MEVIVIDRRSCGVPFPWCVSSSSSLCDILNQLARTQRVTQSDNIVACVLGMSERQASCLTLPEFLERRGVILIETKTGNKKSINFDVPERVDIVHRHVQKMKYNAEEASQPSHTAGPSEPAVKPAGLKPSEISGARKVLQDGRAEVAHPTGEVLGEYPPDIHPSEFDATVPLFIRIIIAMLYYLIIPRDSQALVDAIRKEKDRKKEVAKRHSKYSKAVRLHSCC